MTKIPFFRRRASKRGQSFAELLLVTIFLMIMLAGVVELGFLLNNYLHVFDAAREAARFSSSSVAYDPVTRLTMDKFYDLTAVQALRTMIPVIPRGNHVDQHGFNDDIVVSVFSVQGTLIDRFPNPTGWSLCAHRGDPDFEPNLPSELRPPVFNFLDEWENCNARESRFEDSDIVALLDPLGPPTGILLVEIFYNEDQVLNLPLVSQSSSWFPNPIPNPIPIYVYSVMPISSAEPTSVP